MKITDNRKSKNFCYDVVEEGEVFIYDKVFYIKTDYCDEDEGILSVRLSDGQTEVFEDDTMVTVVNAEITIE